MGATNPLNFADKRTLLVVDDEPDNLTLLSGVLKDEYKVKVANSGARCRRCRAPRSPTSCCST